MDELGVCPAAVNNPFNGENEGRFAGRCCWLIAGTLCEGVVQGSFAHKIKDCTRCAFYFLVRQEESEKFRSLRKPDNPHGSDSDPQ